MAKRRILVVEDDSALATLYRSALSFAGYDVAVAGDGLAALETIDQDHPDLVVTELHMTPIGAAALVSQAAATPDTRHIPFIVLAGSDLSAEELRTSTILRTPCAPGDLVAMVERQLQ